MSVVFYDERIFIDRRPFMEKPSTKYLEGPYPLLEKLAILFLIFYVHTSWMLEYFTRATKQSKSQHGQIGQVEFRDDCESF
jgi:hypothetical protein